MSKSFFTSAITKETTVDAQEKKIEKIPLDDIKTDPNQVRTQFDSKKLEELANSIKEEGILNPIHVYQDDNKYVILTGERRFRAANMAKLDFIPCIIYDSKPDEEKIIAIQLIENLQRSDLTGIEEAKGYQALKNQNLSGTAIARQLGKSEATISRGLSVIKKLKKEWVEEIEEHKLNFTINELYNVVSQKNTNKRNSAYKKLMETRDKEVEIEQEEEKTKPKSNKKQKYTKNEWQIVWELIKVKVKNDKSKLQNILTPKKIDELLLEAKEKG